MRYREERSVTQATLHSVVPGCNARSEKATDTMRTMIRLNFSKPGKSGRKRPDENSLFL